MIDLKEVDSSASKFDDDAFSTSVANEEKSSVLLGTADQDAKESVTSTVENQPALASSDTSDIVQESAASGEQRFMSLADRDRNTVSNALKASLENWSVEKLSTFLKAQGFQTAARKDTMIEMVIAKIPAEELLNSCDSLSLWNRVSFCIKPTMESESIDMKTAFSSFADRDTQAESDNLEALEETSPPISLELLDTTSPPLPAQVTGDVKDTPESTVAPTFTPEEQSDNFESLEETSPPISLELLDTTSPPLPAQVTADVTDTPESTVSPIFTPEEQVDNLEALEETSPPISLELLDTTSPPLPAQVTADLKDTPESTVAPIFTPEEQITNQPDAQASLADVGFVFPEGWNELPKDWDPLQLQLQEQSDDLEAFEETLPPISLELLDTTSPPLPAQVITDITDTPESTVAPIFTPEEQIINQPDAQPSLADVGFVFPEGWNELPKDWDPLQLQLQEQETETVKTHSAFSFSKQDPAIEKGSLRSGLESWSMEKLSGFLQAQGLPVADKKEDMVEIIMMDMADSEEKSLVSCERLGLWNLVSFCNKPEQTNTLSNGLENWPVEKLSDFLTSQGLPLADNKEDMVKIIMMDTSNSGEKNLEDCERLGLWNRVSFCKTPELETTQAVPSNEDLMELENNDNQPNALRSGLENWSTEKLSTFLKAQGLPTASDKEEMISILLNKVPDWEELLNESCERLGLWGRVIFCAKPEEDVLAAMSTSSNFLGLAQKADEMAEKDTKTPAQGNSLRSSLENWTVEKLSIFLSSQGLPTGSKEEMIGTVLEKVPFEEIMEKCESLNLWGRVSFCIKDEAATEVKDDFSVASETHEMKEGESIFEAFADQGDNNKVIYQYNRNDPFGDKAQMDFHTIGNERAQKYLPTFSSFTITQGSSGSRSQLIPAVVGLVSMIVLFSVAFVLYARRHIGRDRYLPLY